MYSFRIRQIPQTGSTNDDVRAAAQTGESEGLVIWALAQNGGRGRRGRVWASPEGNLYASLLLRPQGELATIANYSFVMAIALREALTLRLNSARIGLKWPNDVLIDGRKIAGILLEVEQNALIIGFGVNVLHFPDTPTYPAISLAATGAAEDKLALEPLLQDVLAAFARWDAHYRKEGFALIRDAWLNGAIGLGDKIQVNLPDRQIAGRFVGLEENGALRLCHPDGREQAITAGDVYFGLTEEKHAAGH